MTLGKFLFAVRKKTMIIYLWGKRSERSKNTLIKYHTKCRQCFEKLEECFVTISESGLKLESFWHCVTLIEKYPSTTRKWNWSCTERAPCTRNECAIVSRLDFFSDLAEWLRMINEFVRQSGANPHIHPESFPLQRIVVFDQSRMLFFGSWEPIFHLCDWERLAEVIE